MAFHPSRPFAYVLCELLPLVLVYRSNLKYNDLNTSKIHVFHVGTENGGWYDRNETMFCSRFNLISPPTLTHNVLWTALLRPSWEPDFVLALIFLSFVDLSAKVCSSSTCSCSSFLPLFALHQSDYTLQQQTNFFPYSYMTQSCLWAKEKLLYRMLHLSTVFNFTTNYEKLSLKPNIDKFGKHSQTLPLLLFCTSVHLI